MHVLIIEDDAETAAYLTKGLREAGHVTRHAANGTAGYRAAQAGTYDALVVDRMLPGLDGVSLVRKLRADGDETPVLFLTALAEVDERVVGLRSGGDDYLAKPFAFAELLARIEAIARRRDRPASGMVLKVADLELDRLKRRVQRGDRVIRLQPREFRLLEYLMLHADQVVTRTMLLEQVWGYHFDPGTNVIDVHVSRLRAKLAADSEKPLLQTVRGAGYCLRVPH